MPQTHRPMPTPVYVSNLIFKKAGAPLPPTHAYGRNQRASLFTFAAGFAAAFAAFPASIESVSYCRKVPHQKKNVKAAKQTASVHPPVARPLYPAHDAPCLQCSQQIKSPTLSVRITYISLVNHQLTPPIFAHVGRPNTQPRSSPTPAYKRTQTKSDTTHTIQAQKIKYPIHHH